MKQYKKTFEEIPAPDPGRHPSGQFDQIRTKFDQFFLDPKSVTNPEIHRTP